MSRSRSILRYASTLLLAGAVGYLASMKLGWVAVRPAVLAGAVAATVVAASALCIVSLAVAARQPGRARAVAIAEAVGAAGVVAIGVGGLANWALGLQGAVVVWERDPVRLSRVDELTAFDPGPLANLRELDLTFALARLRLDPVGVDGFQPVSHLRVLDGGEEHGIAVERGKAARVRNLFFRQGAFGFAPRIVLVKDGRRILDAYVPFRSLRQGRDGISFTGEFDVVAERLSFRGAVMLQDLNDDMKGHPRLELAADRQGRSLGAGELSPGESASLGDGYRVTFAGVQRWSEIDFSRRTYRVPILAGLSAVLCAVLLAVGARLRS